MTIGAFVPEMRLGAGAVTDAIVRGGGSSDVLRVWLDGQSPDCAAPCGSEVEGESCARTGGMALVAAGAKACGCSSSLERANNEAPAAISRIPAAAMLKRRLDFIQILPESKPSKHPR